MCGEKFAINSILSEGILGSPPRVRGEASGLKATKSASRITPACAGRSRKGKRIRNADGDHPRVCGEKCHARGSPARRRGSPPRVRGEVHVCLEDLRGVGITPACAGRSWCYQHRRGLFKDHPRVCGEKRGSPPAVARRAGSPPRARGEAQGPALRRGARGITPACAGRRTGMTTKQSYGRITPACAGRSQSRLCALRSAWDHPRVRGEKDVCI